ncbi:unnamed protein product [Amoebophrya sp. A120]|nr:unnamed protein product [Amoebophrya sp. A120]|eukprot:GSA120T00021345001.1
MSQFSHFRATLRHGVNRLDKLADGLSIVAPCWAISSVAFAGLYLKRKRDVVLQGHLLLAEHSSSSDPEQTFTGFGSAEDRPSLLPFWSQILTGPYPRFATLTDGAGARTGVWTFSNGVRLFAEESIRVANEDPGKRGKGEERGSLNAENATSTSYPRDSRLLAIRRTSDAEWNTRGTTFWGSRFGFFLRNELLPESLLPKTPAAFLVADWKVKKVESRTTESTAVPSGQQHARDESSTAVSTAPLTSSSKLALLCSSLAVGAMAFAWGSVLRDAWARRQALLFVKEYLRKTNVIQEIAPPLTKSNLGKNLASTFGHTPPGAVGASTSLGAGAPSGAALNSRSRVSARSRFLPLDFAEEMGKRNYDQGSNFSSSLFSTRKAADLASGMLSRKAAVAGGAPVPTSHQEDADGASDKFQLILESGSLQKDRIQAVFRIKLAGATTTRRSHFYRCAAWRHPFDQQWMVTEGKLVL